MIIIQHKVNSYGDKVINIPSKLYRGISVSLEELQLMELEGIDMYPPKEAIINAQGEKTVGDGNEYGVYMTDSKFAAENYAYRKGDNITSIDKQLRSIKIGAGYEEKIGLSKIGILYEINTEGFNVRNPKVTNYLQGHYNNGYSGHEWISEYIPSEKYYIAEIRIGKDILHDEQIISVNSNEQRKKLKVSIIDIMHGRKLRLNDFTNYLKNNTDKRTFTTEDIEVFRAVFGEDGVKYLSYEDIEPIKSSSDVMKFLMLKTYEKSPENIDFLTFKILLNIQKDIVYSSENRISNRIHGREVVRQIISQRLEQEILKKNNFIERKGKQASTVNFDKRIDILTEVEKMIGDLEKGNIQSALIQSGIEAGIEAGSTTEEINEQTTTTKEQIKINQLLEELGDCIEFLDTNQMNDRMYLEILKRHREEYDDPYDAVIQSDSHYKRNREKEVSDVEEIDETEPIDR